MYGDHVCLPVLQDLHVRQQAGSDPVADQIRHPFLQDQRIGNAEDAPGAILDPDQDDAARGVGEGDDCAQEPVRRGKVPLELQRLALRFAQRLGEIHYSEV